MPLVTASVNFLLLSLPLVSQLLALFRFLCLQIGYAAFRLKHWLVIAVSELSHHQSCDQIPTRYYNTDYNPLPPPQFTTLVTSVFLVVKVIKSDVSAPPSAVTLTSVCVQVKPLHHFSMYASKFLLCWLKIYWLTHTSSKPRYLHSDLCSVPSPSHQRLLLYMVGCTFYIQQRGST